jgi:hypothetical protein
MDYGIQVYIAHGDLHAPDALSPTTEQALNWPVDSGVGPSNTCMVSCPHVRREDQYHVGAHATLFCFKSKCRPLTRTLVTFHFLLNHASENACFA